MNPRVEWMGDASDNVRPELIPQFTRELRATFHDAKAITVYDCFRGYSADQENKAVLGVEVRSEDAYCTHVVKLGARKVVEGDYLGWRKCILKHNFASRIFVSVKPKDLPGDRAAVIYQNAYTLFGTDQSPKSFEEVVSWAVNDDKPDPISVERVICQIYGDLARWFYRSWKADANKALRFYRKRLKGAISPWSKQTRRIELRRDLIWLHYGQDAPDPDKEITYLDPYDYVTWAMAWNCLPQTLVGRSHGDLHGRNILVGVQRGEAEYPAVFDYGAMDDKNVLVWDFVKLETELKVRLLLPLYDDHDAREVLLSRCKMHWRRSTAALGNQPSADMDASALRADRLAFCFEFESLLAELTDRIGSLTDVECPGPPGGRNITGNTKIDRALAILLRIRQEASLWLGDRQPARGIRSLWKDEYYFALAAYGLHSAKFDYKRFETAFALVSAGVAAAHIDAARKHIRKQMPPKKPTRSPSRGPKSQHPYPSYRIPLVYGHGLWAAGTKVGIKRAVGFLGHVVKHFSHAVPLLQEYALVLAEAGQPDKALQQLQPVQRLCEVFCDEETLSRIGRSFKDLGDQSLMADPVSVTELSGHPAKEWYDAAHKTYIQAFNLRKNFYPGINAATLAFLGMDLTKARELAKQVSKACAALSLGALTSENRLWSLVTKGEASVLLRKGKQAAVFYHQALSNAHPDQAGMVQSAYNQVCRLYWALDGMSESEILEPVIKVFQKCPFRLKPGPLGNCGLGKTAVGSGRGRAARSKNRLVRRRPTRTSSRKRKKPLAKRR